VSVCVFVCVFERIGVLVCFFCGCVYVCVHVCLYVCLCVCV
jgi:hypothetical protein